MRRPVAIVAAPSSIGIRPYDGGAVRGLYRAPSVLRERGIVKRLRARDDGDVVPPEYRDFERPHQRPRNEQGVADYSRALATRVARSASDGSFVVVLGGDCSIVLGSLLAFRRRGGTRLGLVYVDAHADFSTPVLSRTGSAASMCLALAVGHGDSCLATLDGREPLVDATRVALVARRDGSEPWYGHEALAASGVLDLPDSRLRERGMPAALRDVEQRFQSESVTSFWLHIDADVIDPMEVPAVDSPTPGGFAIADLIPLLAPLARDPRCLGLQLTIYDPNLDVDGQSGGRLVELLERVLMD